MSATNGSTATLSPPTAKVKHGDSVKVRILGKEYRVNCNEGEAESLLSAAQYLDSQMHSIQQTGKIFGVDRCAIMAALNISAELLALKKATAGEPASSEVDLFIDRIQAKLDSVVAATPLT